MLVLSAIAADAAALAFADLLQGNGTVHLLAALLLLPLASALVSSTPETTRPRRERRAAVTTSLMMLPFTLLVVRVAGSPGDPVAMALLAAGWGAFGVLLARVLAGVAKVYDAPNVHASAWITLWLAATGGVLLGAGELLARHDLRPTGKVFLIAAALWLTGLAAILLTHVRVAGQGSPAHPS